VRRLSPRAPDLEQLLRLYVDGSTEEELADLAGVHPARIPAMLELALEELRAHALERAAAVIQPLLEFLNSEIARNVLIVATRCPDCGGEEQARISCQLCGRWARSKRVVYGPTGYAFPPRRRLAALGRINRLSWRRIKLLELDKPPQISSTGETLAPKYRDPIADYLDRNRTR
jgi:hypothetical protein